MRNVQIYIEGRKIELFEDEQINVTSSVQNINDISKVFTDFSQSFTVPASTVNNEIFQHFYQSDVGDTETGASLINHNIRRNALIEIDLTTFRRGKIQIEKANIKNSHADNYQLTFYGEIRTLKDLFGEDKLNQLDLSSLEFAYDGAVIYNRITDLSTDYDVRYPLIANNRLWTYKSPGEDITEPAKKIQYSELFPAVKVSKLFEAIQTDYNVQFTGTFLQDPKFTNVFLYAKNTNEYAWISEPQNVIINAITSTVGNLTINGGIDVNTDSINIVNEDVTGGTLSATHNYQMYISAKSALGTVYLDVYQNGNLFQTLTRDSVGLFTLCVIQDTVGCDTNITFKVRTTNSMNLSLVLFYEYKFVVGSTLVNFAQTASINQVVVNGNVSVNSTLPDIKVADFFSGILKQFNCTCVATSENTFEILPLEDWYQQGAIVDITQYTDIDSIDVERIKLYKKIAFKYQPSESFVNKNYFKSYNQEYGNVEYQYTYDGDEYTIESPFENLLFTRAEETNTPANYAILGYCLNESFNPYTPKPILLYLYGQSDTLVHDIKFYDGTNTQDISSYALFGQDFTYQNTKYSLNFGADNSVIHAETIQQGLFAQYYSAYLFSLFNLKNRLIYVKTHLPISLLTNLKLNDRLIIRDKRYIINEMKSNLTTGEVNFSLYLDFRRVLGIGQPILINSDAQIVNVPINLLNGGIQVDISTTFPGVTITPNTITTSQFVAVDVPANADTTQSLLAENNDTLITEEFQTLITENSTTQVITLDIATTFSDGNTDVNTIQILQE